MPKRVYIPKAGLEKLRRSEMSTQRLITTTQRPARAEERPTEMQINMKIPWSCGMDGKRRGKVSVWSEPVLLKEPPIVVLEEKDIELPEDETLSHWVRQTYPSVIHLRVYLESQPRQNVGDLWFDLVNALAVLWPLKDLCDFTLQYNGKVSGPEFDRVLKEFRKFPNEQYGAAVYTCFSSSWVSEWKICVRAHFCRHIYPEWS
jgi:hypothetical protein